MKGSILDWILGRNISGSKERRKRDEINDKLSSAISYFEHHNIEPTLDGLRNYTGIEADVIENYYDFNDDGTIKYT